MTRSILESHAAECRAALPAGLTRPPCPIADLSYANLGGADLSGANLHGANLHGANLGGANLSSADLSGADLRYANLRYANLRGANLSSTVLDPQATPQTPNAEQLEAAHLELRVVRGQERVYGWRTVRSRVVGSHEYQPRRWHHANALSVCPDTECHPGIYFGGREYAREIEVWAHLSDVHWVSARKGVRARKIYVTGADDDVGGGTASRRASTSCT